MAAGLVVSAQNIWSVALREWAGIEVPVVAERHRVLALQADAAYTAAMPVFKDLASPGMLYARSYGGRQMLVSEGLPGQALAAPDDTQGDIDIDFVLSHQQWYMNRPDYLRRMVERSSLYMHYIVQELEKRDHRQDHPNNCGIPGYQSIGEFSKPWCKKHTEPQNKAQVRRHQIMSATTVTCNDESQKARNHQQPCLTDEKIAFGCLARKKQKRGQHQP